MHIYNSLTRKKEEFKPLYPPEVKMYVCGPTVYDEAHIGHARSAYIFDVIRRYLAYRGYKVKFVRNVTDVDDKIIDKANKELPGKDLNTAVKEISAKYLDAYHRDMQALGIAVPDYEPKASEYIGKMAGFIEELIKKGKAYQSGADVYFDISKSAGYGKLSNQSLEKMESGSRVSPHENKRNPLDFALWKQAKESEPAWDSPWGKGRPGWHIECSAMSSDILGDSFDIHGGGLDLIFPHHENEIAQSEAAGKGFAKVWIHHGLLTINGQKMAKSLGNFVTVQDFLAKYKNPDLLKLLFLSAHYAHPVDYTEDKIEEARLSLERIMILLEKTKKYEPQVMTQRIGEIGDMKEKFLKAMDDDFNTPQAMAAVFDLVTIVNKRIEDANFAGAAAITIKELLVILGIGLKSVGAQSGLSDTDIEAKIKERNAARKNKDYKLSDKIRIELEAKGVILEDTKDGTTWRRKI